MAAGLLGAIERRARRAAREVVAARRRIRRAWRERSPEVVNHAPDPSLRHSAGHVSKDCEASPDDVPFRPSVRGLRVRGTGSGCDTWVAPGDDEAFRCGLRPGATCTVSAGVALDAPLTGPLAADALRVVVGVVTEDGVEQVVARSHPARNEPGDHRLSVTFTVPRRVTEAWVRLVLGAASGGGGAVWHSLCVTRTDHPVPFFDGATEDLFHDHRWLGAPDTSPSARVQRSLAAVGAAAGVAGEDLRRLVADEVDRATARRDLRHAGYLARALDPRPWRRRDALALVAASRVARAWSQNAAADLLLRTAVRRGDPDGDAAFELGRLAQGRRWWSRAVDQYRTAAERRPQDLERSYRLAHALGRTKETAEAKEILARTVVRDQGLPFDGPAVSYRVLNAFATRREVAFFLVEQLPTIRAMARARLDTLPPSTLRDPYFVYWGQGFAAAPPLVHACLDSLRRADPEAEVHELDDASLPEYVDLPADLLEAVGDNRAHLSDLLRIALLERHGGVWLDATCYVTQPLREHVPALLEDADFFAFTYAAAHLSSWFLAARRGGYLVRMWRAAMWRWWELRGEIGDYFLVHHMFEMLHEFDEEFRTEFARAARLSSRPRHDLQRALLTPYDPERFEALAQASFVHKLTYKLPAEKVTPDTTVAHILRGNPAGL